MALSHARITEAAIAELVEIGFKPEDVPMGGTGKSALEHIVGAVAKAVINEITVYGEVTTTVAPGIGVQVTPATGTGATTTTGTGTGSIS